MPAKIFNDILLKGIRSGQVPARTEAARKWYRDQAKRVNKSQANDTTLIREMKTDRARSRIQYGNMYMFAYDPKHKETLPYYDRFPLIFPINKAEGGFYGINMHYLPPMLRAKLMDALYDTVTNDKFDDTTKLKITYRLLNSASKFKEFKPTVKHYLRTHVRSPFLYVNPSEWDVALFLPSAQFVGASSSKVWSDSRKIIRGR